MMRELQRYGLDYHGSNGEDAFIGRDDEGDFVKYKDHLEAIAPFVQLSKDLRAVGFADNAAQYPRDDLGLVMMAAWLNVRVDQLPTGARYMPNSSSVQAWKRVGEAAIAFLKGQETAE